MLLDGVTSLNMLSSEDISIKTCGNVKDFCQRDREQNFPTSLGKDEHWTTFC